VDETGGDRIGMKASTLGRSPFTDAAIPRVEIIDLTRVMDENLPLYSEGDYSDPPFRMETWCSIPEQGFQVSRLSLGTQTALTLTHLFISFPVGRLWTNCPSRI
jgi:hypothetical protein